MTPLNNQQQKRRMEDERRRQEESARQQEEEREQEESLSGYNERELRQNWQFKILIGKFDTKTQIEAVIKEQSAWGWVFLEKFDNMRIRFKRHVSEASKDKTRGGDPYKTASVASPVVVTSDNSVDWGEMIGCLFIPVFSAIIILLANISRRL